MNNADNCQLDQLTEATRQAALQAFARHKVETGVLKYAETTEGMPLTKSRIGGKPFTQDLDWAVDKNRKALQFWAQVNLEDVRGLNDCPAATGVLMLLISPDYQTFRPKDQSWYKVLFRETGDTAASVEPSASPQFALEFEKVEYVPVDKHGAVLNGIDDSERGAVEAWLTAKNREMEAAASCHQFLGIESFKAGEACIMSAFHANGITFDQVRKSDPHYSHLVDGAAQLVVLWRLGGLSRVFPGEKRDLFICIDHQDLIKMDFQRCSAVFL